MFCTRCGYNLEDNSKFCGNCGILQNQPGIASGQGANPQTVQNGYNYGAAGQPPGQAYYGNYQGSMQPGQGYYGNYPVNMPARMAPAAPRPYSHSLTLGLIAILFIFLGGVNIFFSVMGIGLSIAALILGSLHLNKRSCAVGGFVLGIIFTVYFAISILAYTT